MLPYCHADSLDQLAYMYNLHLLCLLDLFLVSLYTTALLLDVLAQALSPLSIFMLAWTLIVCYACFCAFIKTITEDGCSLSELVALADL